MYKPERNYYCLSIRNTPINTPNYISSDHQTKHKFLEQE
jgi:hypothetical protein